MGGMAELRAVIAGLTGAMLLAAGAASATESAPPAAAKDAPAADLSGVTVTAPDKPNPAVDKTTEFVRQRLPTSRFDQYARFRDPICVKVIGLPAEFDAFVAKRVIEVANKVHAPVAKGAACTPNINVIFSPDPQAQLADIAKRRDILFGFYWKAQLKQTSTFSRPIQSWYLTRSVETAGDGALELNDGRAFMDVPLQGIVSLGKTPIGRAGSRLGEDLSSELVHSLIVADANKVAGEKIDAVADYIAVLALSRWQGLERCSGLPTILNLMADGCDAEDRPQAATPADLALLEGLYAANVRESGSQQRATIASAVRKAAASDGARH
jgi:hypothetical protein